MYPRCPGLILAACVDRTPIHRPRPGNVSGTNSVFRTQCNLCASLCIRSILGFTAVGNILYVFGGQGSSGTLLPDAFCIISSTRKVEMLYQHFRGSLRQTHQSVAVILDFYEIYDIEERIKHRGKYVCSVKVQSIHFDQFGPSCTVLRKNARTGECGHTVTASSCNRGGPGHHQPPNQPAGEVLGSHCQKQAPARCRAGPLEPAPSPARHLLQRMRVRDGESGGGWVGGRERKQ